MNNFTFRNATVNDVPILVNAIIEAEKSGTEKLSYSTIFGLSEEEVRKYLAKMFAEEVDGCELSLSSFMIAEHEGRAVAALSSWIEGMDGISSSITKGNLIAFTLPKKCINRAKGLYSLIHELNIDYKSDTIVLGAGYVIPEYRGQGLITILIRMQIEFLSKLRPDIKEVVTQIFDCNTASKRAAEKLNFNVTLIKESANEKILAYLPSNKKVFMSKIITK